MKAVVQVRRRPQISDPEGATIQRALADLGYGEVETVRVGKTIELTLPDGDRSATEAEVRAMCQQLLTNPVMEDFEIEILD